MKGYMTTAEVAGLLGVTVRRVQAMLKQGHFPGAERTGRDWLIPEAQARRAARTPRPRGRPKKMTG